MFRIGRIGERLARPGDDVVAAVFTSAELFRAGAGPAAAAELAGCFAAKEAVVKALAGAGGQGLYWQDIEIVADPPGPPAVRLTGRARAAAAALGVTRVWLASGRAAEVAVAGVVLEGAGTAQGLVATGVETDSRNGSGHGHGAGDADGG